MINLSLCTGKVPECFKTLLKVPILEVINTNSVEQLRPVNMLPFSEKVLELVVYSYYQSGLREFQFWESVLQLVISGFLRQNDNKS